MLAKKIWSFTQYAMLPGLLVVFGGLSLLMRNTSVAHTFPYYHSFILFFVVITLERIYAYSRAVSQRHMIWRDLMSTAVQTSAPIASRFRVLSASMAEETSAFLMAKVPPNPQH